MSSPTEPLAADDELNPSTEVHPIRFMQIGGVPDLPVPLARVSTCGEMRLLVLHEVTSTNPPLARYRQVQTSQQRKGSSTALNLLKMLVSVPGHVASRDWLSEHLARQRLPTRGREEEEEDLEAGFGRVDNVVSLLRSLLCPDGIEGKKHLRAILLEWQRNHRESGSSYQLAGAPLIWIDVDDITRFTKRASKQEQEGQDALASWERVYELAHKGTYLAQEMYSDWAADRRAEIDGCLKQAVLALQRLYLQRDGDAGEERVLLLLREYWQQHPTNEDIFRPLLEVLNRRHRMQEGLDYYQQLCQRLAEEGQTPDQRTQDMAQRVREEQKSSFGLHKTKQGSDLKNNALFLPQPSVSFSPSSANDRMEPVDEFEKEHQHIMDPIRRSTITGLLGFLGGSAFSFEWWEQLTDRRSSTMNVEAFGYFQQLLEIGWGLSNAGELQTAERVLVSFLPMMVQIAPYRQEAASIAAEGLRLRGILAAHRQQILDKLTYSIQSVEFARQSGDLNILVAELTELAVAFEYTDQAQKAWRCYQEAISFVEKVSPLIQSRLYGRMAVLYAREGQSQRALSYINDAYNHFPARPECEVNFLSSDHGPYKLGRHKGLIYFAMNKLEEAFTVLEDTLIYSDTVIPSRSWLEILNDLGKVAIKLGNEQRYAFCLEEGLRGSIRLKSRRRFDEVIQTFQNDMPKPWAKHYDIEQVTTNWKISNIG